MMNKYVHRCLLDDINTQTLSETQMQRLLPTLSPLESKVDEEQDNLFLLTLASYHAMVAKVFVAFF